MSKIDTSHLDYIPGLMLTVCVCVLLGYYDGPNNRVYAYTSLEIMEINIIIEIQSLAHFKEHT